VAGPCWQDAARFRGVSPAAFPSGLTPPPRILSRDFIPPSCQQGEKRLGILGLRHGRIRFPASRHPAMAVVESSLAEVKEAAPVARKKNPKT
jgi:hypothetical protein